MLWKRLVTELLSQPHRNIYKVVCEEKDSWKIPQAKVSPPRSKKSSQPPKVTGACNIVMMRHGESEWNSKNLFCGWYNAELSERGRNQAIQAGKALKDTGYKFDIAFTSVLKRANHTLEVVLKQLGQENIPIIKSWRLNERHYGDLTGLNKAAVYEKYGVKQVTAWRRSFDIPPPPMTPEHPYYKVITEDSIYRDGPSKKEFPTGESLKLTMARSLPFWNERIVPELKKGKLILLAAHSYMLRGIVKHLDQMSQAAIMKLHLPNGIPFKYTLDENLKPVPNGSLQFLGDSETIKKAIEVMEKVTKQKKKEK